MAYINTCDLGRKDPISYESYEEIEDNEVNLAELKKVPQNSKFPVNVYNFDITKCNAIYDILFKDGQIYIPLDQKVVPLDKRKAQIF